MMSLNKTLSHIPEMKIPDISNVYYSVNSSANYHFILKKRTLNRWTVGKPGTRLTLPWSKWKGLRFSKGILYGCFARVWMAGS
jgi:hypothetical protein